jgi:hypothetical protein
MSRSRRAVGPTISLFPFLAVLLCTMGALLVVLVLFSRSAQHHAGVAQASQGARAEEDLVLARDDLAWRLEQTRGIRDRTAEDLAKVRMQLAGIEENARSLADELARLERTARALDEEGRPAATAADEIAALEARLRSAKESLDEKRKNLADKPPAYAVVPYVGSAGTHRRPLYIECCIDGVFLQPEGIRLSPADFEGPPGPGNPLASALRAAREHLANTQPSPGDPAAQPYPLLLVRPSGVMAYYVAREAIQSWGSEFGYQLIDEDWTLTFPPRDAALAEVERRAVEESRERLAWLAKARPTRPNRPPQQYRAATTRGGVVANGGPTVLGDQSRWDWSTQQKARGFAAGESDGAVGGPFGGGSENATGGGSGGSALLAAAGDRGAGAGGGPGQGGGDGNDGTGKGSGNGSGNGTASAGAGENNGPGTGNGGNGEGGRDARGKGLAPGAGADPAMAGSPGGGASGEAGSPRFAGGSAAGSAASGGGQGSAGGQAGSAGGAGASGSGASQAAGGAGAGGGGTAAMPGMLQVGGAAGGSSGGSMAQSRGKNWASLASADRPVPLTRPIHVECAIDEVRLFDDGARRVQTRIPLGVNTADSIDLLVKAVHDRVAGWGIAGDRMYWRPQLILSETATGRSRREDIERLLTDSGLDTRHKSGDGIRRLPPVERSSAMVTSP